MFTVKEGLVPAYSLLALGCYDLMSPLFNILLQIFPHLIFALRPF